MERHIKTVEFSKRRFKTYFGNIGEMIASEILLKEGFAVWGLKPIHANGSYRVADPFTNNLFYGMRFLYEHAKSFFYDEQMYEETRKKAIALLKDFFGDKLDAFKKYMERIGVIGKEGIVGGSGNEMHEPKSEHIYTPDLICKKGDEIYVVEVKTNSANIYLKPERVRGLLLARKFGLIPLLIHINIRIEASDFVLQELKGE